MIRPATPEDTPELKRLTTGTGVFKPYEIEVLQEVLDEYHAATVGADHTAIVMVEDGQILAYAYYAPDVMTDRTWYLYWIAVANNRRGQGVGSRLMAWIENDIRRRDGRLLFIETSSMPHSELTRKFYLKHGYEVNGILRDFYSDGDDMVVFRKRLANRV
ncbi:MAG: GNAT family N-acetyltransferase [Planctomycetia bacterium]|nr:GNAT family N-acetyltransferase [Planctomycetia bacterium]